MRAGREGLVFLVVLALLAILPAYPAATTEYEGWFGPPGNNYRYANGTTLHPLTEIAGGGLDWRTTSGACVTDGGGWSRFRANPAIPIAYGAAAVGLWLLLLLGLSRAGSMRMRAAILGAVSALLVIGAAAWLAWYGLLFLVCPADFGLPRAIAAGLTAAGLGVGIIAMAARSRLASEAWPRLGEDG